MSASHRPSLVTRASLLYRLRDWNDATSWNEFDRLYRRLVHSMACRAGLTSSEADDIVQDVFKHVAENIVDFETRDKRGAFRRWLKTQTGWRIADKFRERWRDRYGTMSGTDASLPPEAPRASADTPDPAAFEFSDEVWQADWEQHVLEAAMDRIARRVPAKHFQAFDLYARQNWPVMRVARELDMNPATVYIIKHRLTSQLKAEVARLRATLE